MHEISTASSRELAEWLAKDGQLLVPLVELLEKGERAIEEVIDVMGRATVEAVLQMSAEQVAGPKAQGRRGLDREVYWHGVQGGRVVLKERQLRVAKPRLRKKRRRADESGEVEVPAYTALQVDQRLGDRMLELMLKGVSTRRYEKVLPAMADQVGISKSEVSRETIEAGTRVLQELAERDLNELDVLVVYLDGIVFGDYHVLAAVGVDATGRKHVLGLREGAFRERDRHDGPARGVGGARAAGGPAAAVRHRRRQGAAQRHRTRVRQGESGPALSESQGAQRARPSTEGAARTGAVDAAYSLEAGGRRGYPQGEALRIVAGAGVAVGGGEPARRAVGVVHGQSPWAAKPLRRWLTTTNIIDSSHAGVRQDTNRVSRWQSEEMAVRWAAVTFRETEKHYRRITGYEHLWMPKAHLDEEDGVLAELQKAG